MEPSANRVEHSEVFLKKAAYDRVVDVWLEFLSAYEFTVLIHLTRALTSYSNSDYALSHVSLQDGIKSKTKPGEWFIAPLKNAMSLATMRRALDSLEEKGIIRIQRADKKVSRYSIIEGSMPLAIPKRLQEAKKNAADYDDGAAIDNDNLRSQGAHTKLTQSAHCAHTERVNRRDKEESKEETNLHDAAHHGVPDSFGIPDTAQSKINSIKNRSGEKLKPGASIEKVWRAALAESFPQAPFMGWSIAQKGMMNKLAAKWHDPAVPFADFVDWSVRNWRKVVTSGALNWCRDAAETPAIGFFTTTTFNSKFVEAFTLERVKPKDFDFSKNAEYDKHIFGGKTHDEALVAMGEGIGVVKALDRMKKEQRDTVRELVEAEAKQAQANEARRVANRERYAAEQAAKNAPKVVPVVGDFEAANIDFLKPMDPNDGTW